jgi:polysaccharide pyruvyl transferase WcaK-like protein
MRILVEPNAHHLQNMGDVAMLQVAIERLQDLWPEASIEVITDAPALLARYCPRVAPIPAAGRRIWFGESLLGQRVHQALPPRLAAPARVAEDRLRRNRPLVSKRVIKAKRSVKWARSVEKATGSVELDAFFTAASSADLVFVSGAGAINDDYAPLACTILDLMDLAISRHAPTAMLGQGIGPIEDGALLEKAASVLPRVSMIGVREQLRSLALLRSLGVASDRVFVTGDDAIELAYRQGAAPPGPRAIGVNIRMARYSGVDERILERLRAMLQQSAAQLGTKLVGVPISDYPKERDASVIGRLLVGGESIARPADPTDVMRRIRGCRVVVTGSYHAAVFALAQGIPAIGLAASSYYVAKFEGLLERFPLGCQIVYLDRAEFSSDLAAAIEGAWDSADDVRGALRMAAASQVEQGRGAYLSLRHIVQDTLPHGKQRHAHGSGRRGKWKTAVRNAARRAALVARLRPELQLGRDCNCGDQLSSSWDERAEAAVSLLRSSVTMRGPAERALVIGDFGAGNERLRGILSGALSFPHEYHAFDLFPQLSTTTRIDLEDETPALHFDVVFCLGLLEYLHDPSEFLGRLARVCRVAVLSYVLFDGAERLSVEERRARGWLSDLTRDDMVAELLRAGFGQQDFVAVNRGRTGIWLVETA